MTELAEINARLSRIEALLLGGGSAAAPAPMLASLLTVEAFAQACGRSTVWAYRKIASRQVAVTKAGKPYQIPATEVAKFRKTKATV